MINWLLLFEPYPKSGTLVVALMGLRDAEEHVILMKKKRKPIEEGH